MQSFKRIIKLSGWFVPLVLLVACVPLQPLPGPIATSPPPEVAAPSPTPAPAAAPWWPSRYGAEDELGALNEVTPAKVQEAAALIKEGKVYDLQMPLVAGAPAFPPRYYQFSLVYNNVYNSLGSNDFRWSDEVIAGYLGTFTQVDCLGHPGIGERFYNGRHWRDIATPGGLKQNGCEKLLPVMTRGVLIDIAGLKEVEALEEGYEITPEDIEAALKRQGDLTITPGDIVIFHTGWMSLFEPDPQRWISGEPGLGPAAAEWLVERRPAAVGMDTWGIDNWPRKDDLAFPAHQILLTKEGILLLENVVTEELVKDEAYEFAFVMSFLKAKGAGQTWGTFAAYR